MKKVVISGILLFCSLIVYSQDTGKTITDLSLFKVDNKDFTVIIDSVVSFSKRCEGNGLNQLDFSLIIQEVQLNYYQIRITLINCQDLNFLLTSQNSRNKVIGYFVHKNKNFIITSSCDIVELFKQTNDKKVFTTFDSKYLWNIDYTIWDYSYYAPDNKFEMTNFNPICVPEKDRIFPICNDSMNIKK